MDVRCERCRAEYAFDDAAVPAAGLAVRCSACDHVFRVQPPAPFPAPPAAREWRVLRASGDVLPFRELTTLQKWIVEEKVSRDDVMSSDGESWRRLGDIAELESFFQVVDAAGRGRVLAAATPRPEDANARTALMGAARRQTAPVVMPPPPSGFPPPAFAVPPPAAFRPPPAAAPRPPPPRREPPPPRAASAPPAAARAPTPGPTTTELGAEELAAVRAPSRLPVVLGVALLVAAVAGVGSWFRAGSNPRRPPPPELEVRKDPPRVVVAPAPPPAPEPVKPEPPPEEPAPVAVPLTVEVAPPPEPAPPPPDAAVKKPRSVEAELALAERLRASGRRANVERALDLYGRIAGEDPEHVEALVGRGLCYLDLEEYRPAEASFGAALEVDPADADALMGLAETFSGQGKKAEAIQYYERYLALHPGGEEADVARNALEQLRR